MTSKTVFVLEDDLPLRFQVGDGLRRRGFNVIEAGSIAEAEALVGAADDIDVALLDIYLRQGSKTGLEFGIELKQRRSAWPPEFLVYSGHDHPHYYQNAIALGAAAYLQKRVFGGHQDLATSPPNIDALSAHVRALALRRALHSNRPGMADRLEEIARRSDTSEDAVEAFCRYILAEELAATLGDVCVLVLTHRDRTIGVFGNDDSVTSRVLGHVQQAVQSRLGDRAPLIIEGDDADWLRDISGDERESAQKVLRRINGAAFIALGEAKMFRLSLGIRPHERGNTIARDQAQVLDGYLQRPVIRHLLELTEMWSTLQLERQKNRVLLKATSDFCFYQGQELSTLLFDVEKSGTDGPAFKKVRVIAEEMRDAGELLTYFPAQGESNGFEPEPVDMADLVGKVWSDEVAQRLRITDNGFLRVEGRCVASEYPIRAERAVSQILGWLGRRLARLQPEEATGLFVRCKTAEGSARVKVVFEELSSRRVPSQLRETFFKPFYSSGVSDSPDQVPDKGRRLGLYLAHTLADLAGGTLIDSSDSIDGSRGHRFELELPAAQHVA